MRECLWLQSIGIEEAVPRRKPQGDEQREMCHMQRLLSQLGWLPVAGCLRRSKKPHLSLLPNNCINGPRYRAGLSAGSKSKK